MRSRGMKPGTLEAMRTQALFIVSVHLPVEDLSDSLVVDGLLVHLYLFISFFIFFINCLNV
jgi:hypothetical protein